VLSGQTRIYVMYSTVIDYIKGNGSCPLLVKAPFNAIANASVGALSQEIYKPTGLVPMRSRM